MARVHRFSNRSFAVFSHSRHLAASGAALFSFDFNFLIFQRFFRVPWNPIRTSGWISGWEQNGNFIRQLKNSGSAYLCFARALC